MTLTIETVEKRKGELQTELVRLETMKNEIVGAIKECHTIINYLSQAEEPKE